MKLFSLKTTADLTDAEQLEFIKSQLTNLGFEVEDQPRGGINVLIMTGTIHGFTDESDTVHLVFFASNTRPGGTETWIYYGREEKYLPYVYTLGQIVLTCLDCKNCIDEDLTTTQNGANILELFDMDASKHSAVNIFEVAH